MESIGSAFGGQSSFVFGFHYRISLAPPAITDFMKTGSLNPSGNLKSLAIIDLYTRQFSFISLAC